MKQHQDRGYTFADVYHGKVHDVQPKSRSSTGIQFNVPVRHDTFSLVKFQKDMESFAESLDYDPRNYCYGKMKHILAKLPQPYHSGKFNEWVDHREMDALQLCIVLNKPDILRTILENNPYLFPESHTPRINPYAHVAATLGHTKCLELLLTYRPGFYFMTSKPQHVVRFHPDIQKRLRITDSGCTTNKHALKFIKMVAEGATQVDKTQINGTTKNAHNEDAFLDKEIKSMETQVKSSPSLSGHHRRTGSIRASASSDSEYRKKAEPSTAQMGTGANVKRDCLPRAKKKRQHVITVFKDVFKDEPEGVVRGAGPAVLVLTPNDVMERHKHRLPEIPAIGTLTHLSRRNRLMKAKNAEEHPDEKSSRKSSGRTANFSNSSLYRNHNLSSNIEFNVRTRDNARLPNPSLHEHLTNSNTIVRKIKHSISDEASLSSNSSIVRRNFSTQDSDLSDKTIHCSNDSPTSEDSHYSNTTFSKIYNSPANEHSNMSNMSYQSIRYSPMNVNFNLSNTFVSKKLNSSPSQNSNNSFSRNHNTSNEENDKFSNITVSRRRNPHTHSNLNFSNNTIASKQSSLSSNDSVYSLSNFVLPKRDISKRAYHMVNVWVDESQFPWEVIKPFNNSNSDREATSLPANDLSDNKSMSRISRKIELGVRTITNYREFHPVIGHRKVMVNTDKHLNKTPLTLAALNGHLAAVRYLLKTFIQKTTNNHDALTLATMVNSPESIAVLMSSKYSRDDLQSAILVALREFIPECLAVLLNIDQKERHQLFDGENLFHIFYSQSLNAGFPYEMMTSMTQSLIQCREDVNSRSVNNAHPMYTLINCAFHIEAGRQCLYYLECLEILLAAKANPHYNELREDPHMPRRRMNLKRQLYLSAIHCIFASANRSTNFFQNPYWSRAIMRKLVDCIVVHDKTQRRVINDVLFCYMENVCQVGLDVKILRSLLEYGANPDFKLKDKYAINTFFDNMLAYLMHFEVKTNVDVLMNALMCICQAMSCDRLQEAFSIFLGDHLLNTPLQGLHLTRQFCYEVNMEIRTPRPLVRLAGQSIWKNLQRSLPNIRRLPINNNIIALIVPS